MPLTLTLRDSLSWPAEVDGILPEHLAGLDVETIANRPVAVGNRTCPLSELFDLQGDCSQDQTLVWRGDLGKFKRLGEGMSSGLMTVHGNVGMHAGAGMLGGVLEIFGNCGDWAGAEMAGGRLIVHGNAGDLAGAASRGSRRGMTGGELVIHGSAGAELGRKMRRGLIAVGGDCGEYCGVRMIAGTILVFGACQGRAGAGMKRGTVALLGGSRENVLPSFAESGPAASQFLKIYSAHLQQQYGLQWPLRSGQTLRRYCGDLLESGLGELLIAG